MDWGNLWQGSEGPRWAVFSDIDNTYWAHGCESDSLRLSQVLSERNMLLVAVTGARFSSVLRRVRTGELPHFAAVVSAVGTEIHVLYVSGRNLSYQEDGTWSWDLLWRGFDRHHGAVQQLRELVERLGTERPEWDVEPQGGEHQQFKFSLYFRAESTEEAAEIAGVLAQPCHAFRTAWCRDITFSASAGEKKRFCFDVLAADKRDAVDYLVRRMGVEDGLVAGDSGNDATMILDTSDKVTGVVVGGAQPELLEAVRVFREQGQAGRNKRLFVDTETDRRGPQSLLAALEQFFPA